MSQVPSKSTRVLLILAAERLMSEQGIDEVSLREIGQTAGQRNTAAAHYHFGDRTGLIRAVLEYRFDQMSSRSHELLESALETTSPGTPERIDALLNVLNLPLLDQWRAGHFLGFLARLQTDMGRAEWLVSRDWRAFLNRV